jgi:hypothetical protein
VDRSFLLKLSKLMAKSPIPLVPLSLWRWLFIPMANRHSTPLYNLTFQGYPCKELTKALPEETPMARVKADKPEISVEALPTVPAPETTTPTPEPAPAAPTPVNSVTPQSTADITADPDLLETLFSSLKTLLNTVEKLQKARHEVGDIKPLIIRMLDGELLSGEELDQLKSGVNNLSRLVKVYTDYQAALEKAQPARDVLDTILKA